MKKDIKVFIIDKDEISASVIFSYLKETEIDMNIGIYNKLEQAENDISDKDLNIFIVDISENAEFISEQIERTENKYQNCKFIITSYKLNSDIMVKFLRKSKKEFFEKPLIKGDFISKFSQMINKLTSEQDFTGHGKIITVYSNKGGLGKTTIAVNLAMELALSDKTKKTVIVDINSYLGDVTTFLDMTPTYDIHYIADKLFSSPNLSEIISSYKGADNLYVLADSPYRENSNDIPSNALVNLFNALRKEFEYIVVDCSSAITDKTKVLFELTDKILLITVANLPTVNNCKKCLDFFEKNKINSKLLMVLNRYSQTDECSITDIEEYLLYNFSATVPNDWHTVSGSINKGITVSEFAKDSVVSNSFGRLARIIKDSL